MNHTLIRHSSKHYICAACGQSWQGPSEAYCPGLRVIKAGEDWGTLHTKTQLGRAGYKNDARHLPEPVACYRCSWDGSDPEYIMLYEPSQCTRKTVVRKTRRRTGYLSEVVVPASVRGLLDQYMEAKRRADDYTWSEKEAYTPIRQDRDRKAIDLCNAVIAAQLLTSQELAALDAITLTITPFQFRKGLSFAMDRAGFAPQAATLAARITTGYEAWLSQQETSHA
jgi:hypothetical protein